MNYLTYGVVVLNLLHYISAQTTSVDLSYRPSRPFYAPKPIRYPEPIIRPQTLTSSGLTSATSRETYTTGHTTQGLITQSPSTVVDKTTTSPNPTIENRNKANSTVTTEKTNSSSSEATQQLIQLLEELPSELSAEHKPIPGSTTGTGSAPQNTPAVETSTITIEYKPSRPPFAPNPVFYPQPTISTNPTTSTLPSKTVIDQFSNVPVEYKPSRPPFTQNPADPVDISNMEKITFEPNPVHHPEALIPGNSTTLEQDDSTPAPRPPRPPPQVTVSFTSSASKSTPLSLEYKPSRPPYAPNPVHYPQPVIRVTTASVIQSELRAAIPVNSTTLEQDSSTPAPLKYKVSSTSSISEFTPPSLEYKPNRPPYAPNPIQYPQPIMRATPTSIIQGEATSGSSLTEATTDLTGNNETLLFAPTTTLTTNEELRVPDNVYKPASHNYDAELQTISDVTGKSVVDLLNTKVHVNEPQLNTTNISETFVSSGESTTKKLSFNILLILGPGSNRPPLDTKFEYVPKSESAKGKNPAPHLINPFINFDISNETEVSSEEMSKNIKTYDDDNNSDTVN